MTAVESNIVETLAFENKKVLFVTHKFDFELRCCFAEESHAFIGTWAVTDWLFLWKHITP